MTGLEERLSDLFRRLRAEYSVAPGSSADAALRMGVFSGARETLEASAAVAEKSHAWLTAQRIRALLLRNKRSGGEP